jgi:hypothetical protein
MFSAILRTQWKWTRGPVLLASVLAFAIPLASLTMAEGLAAAPFVHQTQYFSGAYPLLASALALGVAMLAWGHDHRGRHVYALTLPIPRWRYALMRLAAGALFLMPPVVALLIGGIVGSASGMIPEGLHAYPYSLALRFGFAAAVAFALFFAVAASTPRTAGIVLGLIAAVFFAQYVLEITNLDIDILSPIVERLFGRGGMLSVFTGRWVLVDA